MGKNKSIIDLKVGESGVISDYSDSVTGCRIMTMGILPNSKVTLIRKGLFAATYYIKLGEQRVALRKKEAASIQLQ